MWINLGQNQGKLHLFALLTSEENRLWAKIWILENIVKNSEYMLSFGPR